MLVINSKTQTLSFNGKTYVVSTAKNGMGEKQGSFCTPTGKFRIAEKIGNGLALGAVLVSRVPTGEIYSQSLANTHPDRDWILTRILWLDGVEAHNKNTQTRYIYIHGTADETVLGMPNSKGCIRMKNTDIMLLFNQVEVDDAVLIE